ncbi:unnamed protein product [Lupinus luteus]|uniref:Uncharacterized protein n=1 Tax=Lupinus luteus TaxID=3873 RepID=A0AAV1XKD1_LUPLU
MEAIAEGTDNVSAPIQQPPIPDDNLVTEGVDLNLPIDLTNDDDDDLPIEFETGLENNLNSQVPCIPSPEVSPHIEQEVQTEKTDVEPPATTLINEDPVEHLPKDSTVCSDVVPTNNTDNVVEEDVMDPHLSKSTSLSDKEQQKKSLVSNLVSENLEHGFNQPTEVHESASHPATNMLEDSQAPPVLSDKVDVEEDMHAKKRGSESDEINDVEPLAVNRPHHDRVASDLNNEHPGGHPPLDANVPGDDEINDIELPAINEPDHDRLASDLNNEHPGGHPPLDANVPGDDEINAIELPAIHERDHDRLASDLNNEHPEGHPPLDSNVSGDNEINNVELLANNGPDHNRVASDLNDEHPGGHPPIGSNVSGDVAPTGDTENIAKEDTLDDNQTNSTSLSRNKPPKMRSLIDLLSRPALQTTGVNVSAPQPPTNVPTNPDSLPVLPADSVDIQEATTSRKRGRGRKGKCPSNKKSKIATRIENEVQNQEEDANTIDTIPHNEELEEFNRTDQTKKWLSLQEVTSNPHLLMNESEATISGASGHNADVNCGKGKEVLIEEIRAEKKAETVGATMTENSNQGATDDIPMDVVEFMAKMQYEKTLPDVGNATNLPEEPTQKESGNIIREESVLPENNENSINVDEKKGKQKKKNINLNQPNSNANINLEKPAENIDVGTSKRKNAKSKKETSKKSTTPFNAVAAAEMLQSAFDPSPSSKKQKTGPSKSAKTVKKYEKGESSKSTKKKEASNTESPWWFNRKINLKDMANRMSNVHRTQDNSSGPLHNIFQNICMVNSNPSGLNVSEGRTASKNNGEDKILENNVPEEKNDLPAPTGDNSKKNLEDDKK